MPQALKSGESSTQRAKSRGCAGGRGKKRGDTSGRSGWPSPGTSNRRRCSSSKQPNTQEAGAQTSVQSFDQLQQVLKAGQTVVVTDTNGRETKGKVRDVSASSLIILSSDTQTFAEPAVLRIRRTDRLANGTLIGLSIGAAVGALGLASTYHQGTDAVYYWADIGVWLSPAAGAALGAIADHATGSEPIYIAPTRAGAGKVTVSPVSARRTTGLSVSFRF